MIIEGQKIKIYDNEGKTVDRYTIVMPNGAVYSASENPSHPQGVWTYLGKYGTRENGGDGYVYRSGWGFIVAKKDVPPHLLQTIINHLED